MSSDSPANDDDWQERIQPSSSPDILIEHAVRYRSAAPMLEAAGTWADLGTGAGVAASLGVTAPPASVLLVDAERSALDEAIRRFPSATPVVTDLCDGPAVAALFERIRELPGPCVVTAFEVIEHLLDHTVLVAALLEAVRRDGLSFVLSVPNDAFSGVTNPYHVVKWGPASFAELLATLPEPHVIGRQIALAGSVLLIDGQDGEQVAGEPLPEVKGTVESHLLVACGPLCDRLRSASGVTPVDAISARVWERQREADLAYYQAKSREVPALEAWVKELEAR